MDQPKVTLYVDIVSPFAYIAFYILGVSLTSVETCAMQYILHSLPVYKWILHM